MQAENNCEVYQRTSFLVNSVYDLSSTSDAAFTKSSSHLAAPKARNCGALKPHKPADQRPRVGPGRSRRGI